MGDGTLGMYPGDEDDEPREAKIEKAYCRHKCPICRLIVPKGDDCIKGCHVECYNEQDSNQTFRDDGDDYLYGRDSDSECS